MVSGKLLSGLFLPRRPVLYFSSTSPFHFKFIPLGLEISPSFCCHALIAFVPSPVLQTTRPAHDCKTRVFLFLCNLSSSEAHPIMATDLPAGHGQVVEMETMAQSRRSNEPLNKSKEGNDKLPDHGGYLVSLGMSCMETNFGLPC